MTLIFVDTADNVGRITDDFSVKYDGSEKVEPYVNEAVDDAPSDEQAVQDILIGMPFDLNIKGVGRAQSST